MRKNSNRAYLLAVLLVVYAFNSMDRYALGLLLQDIKIDLSLTDTQLGLLTGIAFGLFYSVMGIPIAWWADRSDRVKIVAITTVVWSFAVTLCGVAMTFAHLLLIRMLVAFGEAGCVPPAHSLIADHYSRSERPRAVALYKMGGPLSVLVGYFVAGWINEFYGWRMTFVLLGLPGIVLAAFVWVTMSDPRRSQGNEGVGAAAGNDGTVVSLRHSSGLIETVLTLWRNSTFRNIAFSFAVMTFLAAGLSQWQPTFFVRSYGLRTGQLGMWFTLIYGVGGVAGMLAGAELASRFAADKERLQLISMAGLYAAYALVTPFIYLSSNMYIAFGLLGLSTVIGNLAYGPLFAMIQTLVPAHKRATSIAIIYLCANLVGLGFGPLVVGILSDRLRPFLGGESLRYALLLLSPAYLWGAWHLWLGSRTVEGDIDRAQGSPRLSQRALRRFSECRSVGVK